MPQHSKAPKSHPSDRTATRRQVLGATAAGAAVVASGALVATGAGAVLASPGGGGEPSDEGRALAPGDHLVAHVRDVSTGAIDVYVGERQVTIRDRSVAARLAAATD